MSKTKLQGPRHIFIPDTQIKPGVDIEHLRWAGRYIAEKLPDSVIIGGDWHDMPSLSSYDAGTLKSHGKTYEDDIHAGNEGLRVFEEELAKYAPKSYNPRKDVTLGNHENRIWAAVNKDPKLKGTIGFKDFAFTKYGWNVHPFLKPVKIHGITYAHYFPINAKGRVSASKFGAPSALVQAKRVMASCVAGHCQGLDTAIVHTPDRTIRGVIAGSFYSHEEEYLTPLGENYWRGILVFNDIRPATGEFDICEVSLNYLKRRYG